MPTLLNKIYNSTWDRALTNIEKNTPENSVINTWWPPGHFIKSIANRRVTFDGATINYPQAYWMANVFLSQDEREAIGILRMMNNGGNEAAEYLHNIGLPISTSVAILKELAKLNKIQAALLLSKFLKPNQIKGLVTLTHRQAPPTYLMIYNELVDKNSQFAFIGNWNFKEIEKINSDQNLIKEVPKRNSRAYINFLWKLAGGQSKFSGNLAQITQKGSKVVFQDGIIIDLANMDTSIQSEKFGSGVPKNIYYLKEDKVEVKEFENSTLPFSVILSSTGTQRICLLLDQNLARSMLIRMFYFQGKGLKYFKPFSHESNLTKRTEIYVFEVDWKSFNRDLLLLKTDLREAFQ